MADSLTLTLAQHNPVVGDLAADLALMCAARRGRHYPIANAFVNSAAAPAAR